MAKTWNDLKAMTDAELIAEHDRLHKNVSLGVGYLTNELHERAAAAMMVETLASTKAVERMTDAIKRYTRTMLAMNAVAVVIALVALIVSLS